MPNPYKVPETLSFLQQLAANNQKSWFDDHRMDYDVCRAGFTQLVQDWIDALTVVDNSLVGQSAKTAIFRLNRDVRFSANKSPYKTNFSAYLAKGGKKYAGAGFYLHIDPKGSFLACGIWMPPSHVLQAIRQEIDYNLEEFEAILQTIRNAGEFTEMSAERLSRPPKGYAADNPAMEHLKQKSFVLAVSLEPATLKDEQLIAQLCRQGEILQPFAAFLNRAVDVLDV